MLIRHLWQLKTVVFLQWCAIRSIELLKMLHTKNQLVQLISLELNKLTIDFGHKNLIDKATLAKNQIQKQNAV